MIKVLKYLQEGRQAVVEENGQIYLVSQSIPMHTPVETLVFRSDVEGKVTDWVEVGGEVGCTIDQYLSRCLNEGKIIVPWAGEDLPW